MKTPRFPRFGNHGVFFREEMLFWEKAKEKLPEWEFIHTFALAVKKNTVFRQ